MSLAPTLPPMLLARPSARCERAHPCAVNRMVSRKRPCPVWNEGRRPAPDLPPLWRDRLREWYRPCPLVPSARRAVDHRARRPLRRPQPPRTLPERDPFELVRVIGRVRAVPGGPWFQGPCGARRSCQAVCSCCLQASGVLAKGGPFETPLRWALLMVATQGGVERNCFDKKKIIHHFITH